MRTSGTMHDRPQRGSPATASIPLAGGVGLRFPHHERFLQERPRIAWLEVHSENYLGGGTPRRCLDALRCDYPISLHGVGLSLGSAQELDFSHLERIATLVAQLQPQLVSEHLSWSIVDRRYFADLLPLPLTDEALEIVCRHVDEVQELLRRRILIENPSTYLEFEHSSIPEWEFLAALASRTGCGLLCDVNNVFVSAINHGWDAARYLRGLPIAAIEEIHLAGHATRVLQDGRVLRIDDHGSRVAPAVWQLYREALSLFGPKPTLIEWDTSIPPLEVLMEEAAQAQRMLDESPPASRSPSRAHDAHRRLAEAARAPLLHNASPGVLDVQQAMGRRLMDAAHGVEAGPSESSALPGLDSDAKARLSIYRNTCRSVLANALRLTYPAVQRLVGKEFFEGAAHQFIEEEPYGVPHSAWLNEYGESFAAFLASFPAAQGVPYLADVARLEWAVNKAIHAPDSQALDVERLRIGLRAPADVRFVSHRSVSLLTLQFPVDVIWRAVLACDEVALRRVDLSDGPVWLLIERGGGGAQVRRLAEPAWRFTARLCAGEPLHAALDELTSRPELHESAAQLLAEHLSAGRFIDALSGGSHT